MHNVSFVYEYVHNLASTYFKNYFPRMHNIHSIDAHQSQKGDPYLLCHVKQLSMGSILLNYFSKLLKNKLIIKLLYYTGILYLLKSEILTPFPTFGKILKAIF